MRQLNIINTNGFKGAIGILKQLYTTLKLELFF